MVNCLSQSVSQIYKNGNIYGLDGVYEGAQALVPLWQIRYPSRTADGTRLVCQEFLTLERVVMLHVTILCLIFGAIVTTFTPKSRACVELQDAHWRRPCDCGVFVGSSASAQSHTHKIVLPRKLCASRQHGTTHKHQTRRIV